MKRVYFLYIVLCVPILLHSAVEKYIRFEQIIPDFPSSSIPAVSSILQDAEGYIWFGTDMGLARYDGYHFTLFPLPSFARKESHFPVAVYPMVKDNQGNLWLGTNGFGLFCFSRKSEKFISFEHDPDNEKSLCGDIVISLQKDKNGDLYIGTRANGLCRYERQNNTFSRISLGEQVETIWDLWIDSRHRIWAGTQNFGLFRLDPDSQKIHNYKHHPGDPKSIGSNSIWSIFEDRQGTIWVGTKNGGLSRFDGDGRGDENGTESGFTSYMGRELGANSFRYSNISSLWEDDTGKIWAGTSGEGIRVFDPSVEKFTAYRHRPGDPDSLSDDYINAVYQDRSGIMWIATQRGGINKSLNNQVKFEHFKSNPLDPHSLGDSNVHCIYRDQSGYLWIGTSKGLEGIDEKTGFYTHFIHDPKNDTGISAGAVQAVLEDDEGSIWLGMAKTGLARLNTITGKFTHYSRADDSRTGLSNNSVRAIRQDKVNKDILWIGTQNGLNRFNRKTGRFTYYFSSPSDPSELSSSKITTLLQDGFGDLWVGTLWGLNRMDKKTGGFTRFMTGADELRINTVLDNHITSILEDRKGIMWIGTIGGISKYDRIRQTWTYYTVKEGLPGDIICGILEDEAGNLWISTNRGLVKFDLQTESFRIFNLHDGIQSHRFNSGAFFKSGDGRMYFGGMNGYNRFYPKDIQNNPRIPPVVWSGFYVNNKKHDLGQPLSCLKNISLYEKMGFITFEFAALCFINPERNQFAFKLEGRDYDWTYTGPNRTISFPSLAKGEYVLRVKAANPDGVWNEQGLSLSIRIIPPFWKTWWFLTFFLVIISFVIFSWIRTRTKLRTAQIIDKENLEKVVKKYNITQREKEIITMILDGAGNKDIEKKLFISSSTVRNHIYNIYQKLGIQNRIELINLIKKQT